MARKRQASELGDNVPRPRRADPKRAKPSIFVDERSDSSNTSSGSVSEDSALRSSPPASVHNRQDSVTSIDTYREDDSESSMSTSSEESSDTDSDEGSGIVTVGGPQKPFIDKAAPTSSASDLQARLAALLPELAAANRQLEQGGKDYDMEDVQDGEQHIEMNLGLGVLEEKHGDETSAEEESSEDESEVDEDTAPTSLLHEYRPQDKDTRVMQKLTGQHKTMQRKVAIEELG